jgi:hypothetical protein
LEKWRIEKTANAKAYKIIFFHGPKFHRDQRRRIQQKTHAEQSVVVAESEPDLPEPGKLESPVAATIPAPKKTAPTVAELGKAAPEAMIAPTSATAGREDQPAEFSLIDELSSRGIMPSVAIRLLAALSPEKQEDIPDYIRYWDGIRSDKRGPGLLVTLIQNGQPLPSSFETTRKKRDRIAVDNRRRKLAAIKEALTVAYEEHRHGAVDRYIKEQFPPEEFERRVAAYMGEHSAQTELWNRPRSSEAIDHTARQAVRADIAKTVTVLPFDEFRKTELPKILAELEIDPADLGIDLPKSH